MKLTHCQSQQWELWLTHSSSCQTGLQLAWLERKRLLCIPNVGATCLVERHHFSLTCFQLDLCSAKVSLNCSVSLWLPLTACDKRTQQDRNPHSGVQGGARASEWRGGPCMRVAGISVLPLSLLSHILPITRGAHPPGHCHHRLGPVCHAHPVF